MEHTPNGQAPRLPETDSCDYHIAEILREAAELMAQTRQIIQQARTNLWCNPELTAVMLEDLEHVQSTAQDCTAQVASYLQSLSAAELYLPRWVAQSEPAQT